MDNRPFKLTNMIKLLKKQDTVWQFPLPKRFVWNTHPVMIQLLFFVTLGVGMPSWIYRFDNTAALPDLGISYLFLLALLFFLLILTLVWKLFNKSWERLGLPDIHYIVGHFKTLDLWQQILLYWLSFALIFLAAIGSLIAIY